MNTFHLWFPSGSYSLLGHIDASRESCGCLGAVIVPPFGWEEVCSYRPLRLMARALAARGIPTLRYDLPGTGDSSGDARDPGLLEAWIRSVGDAAAQLRTATAVKEVAVVGIHLGAMLAVSAAARGGDFQELVLWGGAASGRAVLREMRAVANMERWESLSPDEAPPQPIPGFEVGGFLLSPETQRDLELLDLSDSSCPRCRRILLLSRDDLPHDAKLARALRSPTDAVEVKSGPGYAAMMGLPHEVVHPETTSRLIADFLTKDSRPEETAAVAIPASAAHPARIGDALESVYTIESCSTAMFGVLAEPADKVPRSEFCILYLNAGGVRHTGPNRMWVESARRWAARGVVSLRIDLEGIGESDGDQLDIPGLYQDRFVDQIGFAIRSLRRHSGLQRFAAIGLCSGAFWAFHAAIRHPDVGMAILLNPRLFFWDPAVDERRVMRRIARGSLCWADWWRLARGGFRADDIKRAGRVVAQALGRSKRGGVPTDPPTISQAWSAFELNRKRVTLVFREGEPLLREMEEAGQLPPDNGSYARLFRVPNGGHTFRPLWAQKLAHDLIDNELASVILADAEQSLDDVLSGESSR